jgi:hypothetical protein
MIDFGAVRSRVTFRTTHRHHSILARTAEDATEEQVRPGGQSDDIGLINAFKALTAIRPR